VGVSVDTDDATASAAVASALPVANGGPPGLWVSRLVLTAVLGGYASVSVVEIVNAPIGSRPGESAAAYAALVIIFGAQFLNSSSGAAKWRPWRRAAMLAAQAAAVYLPLPIVGNYWLGLGGFLAGSALLLVTGWAAWALFAVVVASMPVISLLAFSGSAANVAYAMLAASTLGLFVFGLSRLSLILRYVHAARGDLAQLAIVRERVRFARDLHDLLGYSLSAITLKAELARRLVVANPGRSRDEIAELLDIARQALADVRTVSSGYRSISLSKEADAVASLLTAAGIEARVQISCGPLAEPADTVMATVVRESVTNMLHHSAARACSVEAEVVGDVVRLRIRNDGVERGGATSRPGGGLENLAARLHAIGGRLTATIHDGQFHLLAEAPVIAPTQTWGTRCSR
jgi:two-component system sensor histidine kinase DesK